MKTRPNTCHRSFLSTLATGAVLFVGAAQLAAEGSALFASSAESAVTTTSPNVEGFSTQPVADAAGTRREMPWLGVSADEAPEALTAQLALEPGVGLVVSYVTKDSPAEQAGLKKNDLLVEFEGQALVHPAQLRKLVQSRKDGDLVKLTYYRGGRKETATAKLGTTKIGFGLPGDELAWGGDVKELQRQLAAIPLGEAFRDQMNGLRDSLRREFGPEQRQKIEEQVRESVEAARRAAREAMEQITNARSQGKSLRLMLDELAESKVALAKDARLTFRNSSRSVKTMVQTDDTGTYVLIATPTKHLSVHDKDGRQIFDGEIETPEQQAKVPPALWDKAKFMVEKLAAEGSNGFSSASDSDQKSTRKTY